MTFQRARSAEQREIRRQAILDTAAGMLVEMPVSQVSLNELSRRVGLAKSNVLRYFESREAILLELLDRAAKRWMAELDGRLAAEIDPAGTARQRIDQMAAVIARSLAPHPVLCDLLSAQAGVLEHNVSVEVAIRYKRAAHASFAAMAELIRRHLPELGNEDCWKISGMAMMFVGALWTHMRPSASVRAAYEADPSLAAMHMDFTEALELTLATIITGALARTSP